MNVSKRVSSSIVCHGQRSSKNCFNTSSKICRRTASSSSASLHTGAFRCSKGAKGQLQSSRAAALRQPSAARLAIHFRSESNPRNNSSRAFSTRLSDGVVNLKLGRSLHSSAGRNHGEIKRPAPGEGITVHFHDSSDNLLKTIEGNEGDSLLDLAHEHDIDMEGACEGSVACSTCHVILTPEYYDKLEEPEDDENDMLDMAFGLTDTSRLGCQVKLTKELDGMVVTLPSATRNFFVDGAKPTKH